ncbi:DUF3343 domain-containing protein [Clostridium sp. D53t1_180928_C8]|uniref:DUF3343 domain-containing protein n=1 Tax=Clostridium sp. D53t1_180928_C8 TaxID=2787101 RepID=UPI0018A8ACFB|nr:DUF3343 domain-containing protein [Clostridium sp. D53t1_180928_C8]
MSEKPIYIITFDSANNSMLLYRLLKGNQLNIYMIQTPCCLSAGCARSIEVDEAEIDKVIELVKNNNIPIRAIHKKYVNPTIRRYCYEEITF